MGDLAATQKEVALIDLLDRALDKGVMLWGDLTLSVAGVDLVYLGLKVLLSSIEQADKMRAVAARALVLSEPQP